MTSVRTWVLERAFVAVGGYSTWVGHTGPLGDGDSEERGREKNQRV